LTPKSNLKLKFGDYSFVKRDDGQMALFIFICPKEGSRNYFYGAFANELISHPNANLLPTNLSPGDHALIHSKCYRECNLSIDGNLAAKLDSSVLPNIEEKIQNMNIGSKHRVWGYKVLLKHANKIAS